METYYVYIMASHSRTLYVGITNSLARRVTEHRQGLVRGVTQRYRIRQLVYFEEYSNVHDAIAREKQIKGWRRSRKVALIESENPGWADLHVVF